MPVVVIGAWEPVGKALIPHLLGAGSEVRAVVPLRDDADSLRKLGAKVAVGDPTDSELLAAVLRDAHTLCLLSGELFLPDDQYDPVIAGTARAAVEAAREADLSRIVLLSYPGADPDSPNAYLRALGKAEEAASGSGIEHVTVRSVLSVAPDSDWLEVLRGGHRMAPVYVEDLAAVLAAADDRAQPVGGTFGLQGPDTVTADELAGLARGGSPRRARLRRSRMSRAAREILSADSLADAPDAAAEFGVKLTPLRDALRAARFVTT